MVKYGTAQCVPAAEYHRQRLPLSACGLLYSGLILRASLGAYVGGEGLWLHRVSISDAGDGAALLAVCAVWRGHGELCLKWSFVEFCLLDVLY